MAYRNAEDNRQQCRRYYLLHRDRIIASSLRWAVENPEKTRAAKCNYYSKNKANIIAKATQWDRANPDKSRARCRRHQARKLHATVGFAGDDVAVALLYKKAVQLGLDVDHVVPLQHPLVCGLHTWHNLQLLSRSENGRKGNRFWPDMP